MWRKDSESSINGAEGLLAQPQFKKCGQRSSSITLSWRVGDCADHHAVCTDIYTHVTESYRESSKRTNSLCDEAL
ncbi:unnamed protein product [Chondrus crispus]|uniref:Uncharacterized protein n=1 Tax=Chondrus crispus TaxID=2769 RepID=R7Q2N1_CHOCR|nr:unnamed protein product [Chondrus crispus]CDF32143.1 unnamed protein product [Chondrus crispus]|eukprot:XP_005711808.1 unnamed protein product [Chondrus crispus]